MYLIVFGVDAPIVGWVSDKVGNKRQLFLSFSVMNISLLGLSIIRNLPIFAEIIVFFRCNFFYVSLQSSLSEFVGASESCGYAFGLIMTAYIYEMNKSFLL